MGISGLMTFIQNNRHLFQDFKLHDTKVIIDGLNFCYYLYANSKIDYVHGGDYDKFGKLVSDVFGLFLKCNVEAVIILDGAHDISGRKLRTIEKNATERLSIVQHIAEFAEHPTQYILPQLTVTVFKSVLADLKVQVYCSEYEADEHIAALAKHFECPVLSMDSDFYIFDIPSGYIPLNLLNLDATEEANGTFRLTCSIYYIDRLLSHFPGIQKEVLFALFGTVMGNDYVNSSVFDYFFQRIQISRGIVRGIYATKRHIRMVILLQWLQYKSFNEAISMILTYLANNDREMVESLIRNTVDGYTHCCEQVKQYSLGESETAEHSRLVSLRKNTIPTWFIKEYQCANLSSFVGNVLATQKVYLKCQVEDLNSPSAYDCSLPIRKAMYSILLCSDTDSLSVMEEYNRNYSDIKFNKIIVGFSETTPKFSLMPSIKLSEKLGFILQVLSCDNQWLNMFPSSWHLLMACVQFVARFATPSLTDEFISSVLLSCLLLSFEDLLQSTCRTMELKIDEECVEKARCNLKCYFKKPEHDKEKAFLIRIVHSYSQIQSCVIHASYLNALLQNPLVPIKVNLLLNGSFIYNMTCDLENSAKPELYISEALGRDTDLDHLYSRLKDHFMDPLVVELKAKIKNKSKKPKTKKKKKACSNLQTDFNLLDLDDSG